MFTTQPVTVNHLGSERIGKPIRWLWQHKPSINVLGKVKSSRMNAVYHGCWAEESGDRQEFCMAVVRQFWDPPAIGARCLYFVSQMRNHGRVVHGGYAP